MYKNFKGTKKPKNKTQKKTAAVPLVVTLNPLKPVFLVTVSVVSSSGFSKDPALLRWF